MFSKVPQKIIDTILNSKRVVVCGHLNPDGDCANSVLSMGFLLKGLKKDFILVNDGSFSRPEISDFANHLSKDIPESWKNKETLGLIVDCSTMKRLGKYGDDFLKLNLVVVDHHSNGDFVNNDNAYIVSESPSTTLLIYQLFKALEVNICPQVAVCIFRGFATDSGYFKFLNKDSAPCFEIVADLVRHGVNPSHEYIIVNGGKPLTSVKFLSALIDRTQLYFDNRLAISFEKQTDSADFGENARTSDDYYAQMFLVKGIEAIVFFKISNKVENAIEVGFRVSHDSKINVGDIAAKLGGGGHTKAAGATIKGSLDEVKEKTLAELKKAF